MRQALSRPAVGISQVQKAAGRNLKATLLRQSRKFGNKNKAELCRKAMRAVQDGLAWPLLAVQVQQDYLPGIESEKSPSACAVVKG